MPVTARSDAPAESLLATLAQRFGADAVGVLRRCLRPTLQSQWPEVAWRSSRLTADGFPLELSFASGSAQCLRWTAEAAPPEMPAAQRAAAAWELLQQMQPGAPPPPFSLNDDDTARWGGWLGARARGSRVTWKLYKEVTGASTQLPSGVAELLPWPCSLRMLAWEPSAQRLEVYVRAGRLDRADVTLLLTRAGLDAVLPALPALLELLDASLRRQWVDGWVGTPFGLSIGLQMADGGASGVIAASVMALSSQALGFDAAARAEIERMAVTYGWDMDDYLAVSSPLADRWEAPTRHGMLTWSALADGATRFHVGLRPPT